jgi:hypothetical protein
MPARPNYWHCCWDHYLLDKERKGQPLYDVGYRDGYRAGYAAGRTYVVLDPEVWRSMLKLCHPDHYQGSLLCATATEVTKWLIAHREATRN